jgi:hypothetical protein
MPLRSINISPMFIVALFFAQSPTRAMDLRGAISSGESNHYECSLRGGEIGDCRAVGTFGGGNFGSDHRGNGNGDHGGNHSSDLHCEVGYVGTDESGKVFVTKGGMVCTESEVLQATAFLGNWPEQLKQRGIVDPVIPGMQASLAMIIVIFRKFGYTNPTNGGFGAFAHVKQECALEYIAHRCLLENINHFCFKDFRLDNEPRYHFKSEEERQRVMNPTDPIMRAILGL